MISHCKCVHGSRRPSRYLELLSLGDIGSTAGSDKLPELDATFSLAKPKVRVGI